jgi:hypothetical protein
MKLEWAFAKIFRIVALEFIEGQLLQESRIAQPANHSTVCAGLWAQKSMNTELYQG